MNEDHLGGEHVFNSAGLFASGIFFLTQEALTPMVRASLDKSVLLV